MKSLMSKCLNWLKILFMAAIWSLFHSIRKVISKPLKLCQSRHTIQSTEQPQQIFSPQAILPWQSTAESLDKLNWLIR